MDLSIIIVSWNIREQLRACLSSIAETMQGSTLRYSVSVVDNASTDGSATMVREEFPDIRLIANEENRGFAAANNQSLQRDAEKSEFVLLLNPDMRVLPGTLDGIVQFMRRSGNERVGVAGCKLIDDHGAIVPHVRHFPTLLDQFAVLTKMARVMPRLLDRYLMRDFDTNREADVDSIRGAFFCIRSSVVRQLGMLDEDYFVWFEEVDFCRRVVDAGWRVVYTPSVKCIDYVGQSFRQVRLFRKQRYFTKSMCTYFRKHRPWWEYVILVSVRPFVLAVAWVLDRFR
ncbi:MAG: glycosyltransferase family 2 protein [Candidatus Uhrbacteria bacterium]